MAATPPGRYRGFIERLDRFRVRYLIVGGIAAILHGSARTTFDLDLVYDRALPNLEALASSLADISPYPRGAPPGLPFDWSSKSLQAGLNFTLTTELGSLDLLGEIVGGGTYDTLLPHTIEAQLYGIICRYLDLETLIRTKRAAGRPKDFEAIAELETILSQRRGGAWLPEPE